MTRVHQVLASASRGDVTTEGALRLRDRLRALGPSEVFAGHVDASVANWVVPLEAYAARAGPEGGDLIACHTPVEPTVASFLRGRPEPLALVGDELVDELNDRVVLAVATSESRANELRAAGVPEVAVSPPIVDVGVLRATRPAPDMVAYLDCFDGPMLLCVADLVPDERPDWLLAAYSILVTYLEPLVHLVLVGGGGPTPYRRALDTFVAELNLPRAHLVGRLGPEALAACYRRAVAVVMARERPGGHAPILEAMAFELPVLARASPEVGDGLDRAAVVLRPDDGPTVAAEAMSVLVNQPDARATLAGEGRRVLEELDADAISAGLVDHLRAAVT